MTYSVTVDNGPSQHSPVNKFASNTALEETRAAVARQDAIMFTAGRVPADHTQETRRVLLHWTAVQGGRGHGPARVVDTNMGRGA